MTTEIAEKKELLKLVAENMIIYKPFAEIKSPVYEGRKFDKNIHDLMRRLSINDEFVYHNSTGLVEALTEALQPVFSFLVEHNPDWNIEDMVSDVTDGAPQVFDDDIITPYLEVETDQSHTNVHFLVLPDMDFYKGVKYWKPSDQDDLTTYKKYLAWVDEEWRKTDTILVLVKQFTLSPQNEIGVDFDLYTYKDTDYNPICQHGDYLDELNIQIR